MTLRHCEESFALAQDKLGDEATLAPHCVWCSAGVPKLQRDCFAEFTLTLNEVKGNVLAMTHEGLVEARV